MNYTLLCLPVLLPVVFWAAYHYYKDHHLPEPPGHLALAFLLGIGTSYLAGWMYQALELIGLRFDAFLLAETNPTAVFFYAIGVIGPIEEFAKLLPFLLVIIRFKEFDEPLDGIIYASFIALGYAAIENLQYVQMATTFEAAARSFAGPVVHMVFASIWGYYIGRAWLCGRPFAWVAIFSWLVAAFIHGVYDFVVIALPPSMLPVAAVLIAALWGWRLLLIRDLHELPAGACPPGIENTR